MHRWGYIDFADAVYFVYYLGEALVFDKSEL